MTSLAAGAILAGRYRLVRVIGHGAIGDVWLADGIAESGPVALKIARDDAGAAALAAAFAQAQKLAHPGIVRLHGLVPGPPAALVMQYVNAPGIGALRGAGYRVVLRALLQVADALEYAHRHGVVHRDLKAANVLCDESGRCTVVDFGVGALAGGGTLPSMSPQQLDGAPPAVADDVYAFGALLHDLIAGEPLFHPDVTPARVRDEAPSAPLADLTGEPLPDELRRLLGALLRKSPAQRPPGMAAVRSALEDLLRDHGSVEAIRPRPRASVAPSHAAGEDLPSHQTARARRGPRAAAVYAALALCVALAAGVVFYLPALVRERGPIAALPAAAPASTPQASAPASAAPEVSQAQVDAALGEFLQADDALRQRHAETWGGEDWAELRRRAEAADAAARNRDLAAALASYGAAGSLAKGLLERAPQMAADALREGEAAIDAGNQPLAVSRLEHALAIEPDNAAARRALARARNLERVLALLGQANAAEASSARADALRLYREAAVLDPASSAAAAGVQRLMQAAASEAYESQMARGFAAQAARDSATARTAFEAALRARPGDSQAGAALAQAEADLKLAGLAGLQSEARELERAERWSEAARRYDELLARDPNLADARAGRERASRRATLDERLERELRNADRFNDDAVLAAARAVLDSARAVPEPGPVLARQVAALDALLAAAMQPVSVTIESDNLTEVTLFKVGRLGAFAAKTLELRPGAYTAVGSRPGYRDVRRSFRVAPGQGDAPVVVRCEEPI